MTESSASTKPEAEIPYGLVEYTAVFKNPILEAWTHIEDLTFAVLSALSPLGFKLEGVELKMQAEKISERAVVFRRTPPGIVFSLGLEKLYVSAENLDWSEAERFIAVITDVIGVVHQISKFKIETQHIVLGMHVQVKEKSITQISAHLLNPAALRLMDGEVKTHGIILHRDKSSILIDGSAAFANAFFVRIAREHPAEATLQDIAGRLLEDERLLFEVLGITGVL